MQTPNRGVRGIRRKSKIMKVTLKQIAERTGVSINTVSMVLRGMSGISAPTRDRVRRAAEEMGYRRQLKPAATKQSLCLVSAERHRRESYSYTEFNRNFLSYAASHEFSVVTAEAEQFRDDPEGAQRRIEEAGVGGILTLGDIDESLFVCIRRCGLPIVAVGARYYREPVCTFTEDNEMAAHQVVHALMERGFTRIGFAGSPLFSAAFSERYFGFRQSCYRAGISVQTQDEWLDLLPGNDNEETESTVLRHLERQKELPEAFFCGNDLLAVTLAKVFRRNGVRVPEDISLVGVDFNQLGQMAEPRLTTVDIGCSRQVEAAVEQLIAFIETNTYKPARVLLPTALRWGDSIGTKRPC